MAWNEFFAEYCQESMDRCTGCCSLTEIMLKSYKHCAINQFIHFISKDCSEKT